MEIEPFNGDGFLHAEVSKLIEKWQVDLALETGTFYGHTTVALALLCKKVYTVEVDETSRNAARLLFEASGQGDKITSLLGSSPEVIRNISGELEGKRTLYYLDAHWGDYWPLLDEIAEIEQIRGPQPIIVIHDFKVPGRTDLGYDSYGCQALDLAYVETGLRKIYGGELNYYYNEMARGANRGVLFVEPVK